MYNVLISKSEWSRCHAKRSVCKCLQSFKEKPDSSVPKVPMKSRIMFSFFVFLADMSLPDWPLLLSEVVFGSGPGCVKR